MTDINWDKLYDDVQYFSRHVNSNVYIILTEYKIQILHWE